jgi:hypothetical protein
MVLTELAVEMPDVVSSQTVEKLLKVFSRNSSSRFELTVFHLIGYSTS